MNFMVRARQLASVGQFMSDSCQGPEVAFFAAVPGQV
jgi:hypothetical protein